MSGLTLTTFDWVPEGPRGFVRDVRIRWALEEARLPYSVRSAPFKDRGTNHFQHQPFGQVPWLTDGEVSIFESGAMMLHIAERSETLMPTDPKGRASVLSWMFAALNSVEIASQPVAFFEFFSEHKAPSIYREAHDAFLAGRLKHMETVLAAREWLTGTFSAADILMADVLRWVDEWSGLDPFPQCRGYVAQAIARPAFAKAHADQLAHFTDADRVRAKD